MRPRTDQLGPVLPCDQVVGPVPFTRDCVSSNTFVRQGFRVRTSERRTGNQWTAWLLPERKTARGCSAREACPAACTQWLCLPLLHGRVVHTPLTEPKGFSPGTPLWILSRAALPLHHHRSHLCPPTGRCQLHSCLRSSLLTNTSM